MHHWLRGIHPDFFNDWSSYHWKIPPLPTNRVERKRSWNFNNPVGRSISHLVNQSVNQAVDQIRERFDSCRCRSASASIAWSNSCIWLVSSFEEDTWSVGWARARRRPFDRCRESIADVLFYLYRPEFRAVRSAPSSRCRCLSMKKISQLLHIVSNKQVDGLSVGLPAGSYHIPKRSKNRYKSHPVN